MTLLKKIDSQTTICKILSYCKGRSCAGPCMLQTRYVNANPGGGNDDSWYDDTDNWGGS